MAVLNNQIVLNQTCLVNTKIITVSDAALERTKVAIDVHYSWVIEPFAMV